MARQCYLLTAAELAAMLAAGYTQISGPHDSQAECEFFCDENIFYPPYVYTPYDYAGYNYAPEACPALTSTVSLQLSGGNLDSTTEFSMVYNSGSGRWEGFTTGVLCSGTPTNYTAVLQDLGGGNFGFALSDGASCNYSTIGTNWTCDTLFSWTGTADGNCCGGVTWLFTEVPA